MQTFVCRAARRIAVHIRFVQVATSDTSLSTQLTGCCFIFAVLKRKTSSATLQVQLDRYLMARATDKSLTDRVTRLCHENDRAPCLKIVNTILHKTW